MDGEAEPAGVRGENVAVLVVAALVVGFLIGQAVGRRQGLEVRQVVLPEQAQPTIPLGEMPKAPKSIAEAREMVAGMGEADPALLVSLGDRKLSNHHPLLAVAFYERALELQPDQPEVWASLARASVEAGLASSPQAALDEALARARDRLSGAEAESSRRLLATDGPLAAAARQQLEAERP